jgi:hypothetical protein
MNNIIIIILSSIPFLIQTLSEKEEKHIDPADTVRYINKGNIREYEIVEEINLDKDVYRVWFGKDSKYPRFILTRGKIDKNPMIIFYDDNFSEIKRIETYYVYLSPNSEYIFIKSIVRQNTEINKEEMECLLMDREGNNLWGKSYTTGYECKSYIYFVSDEGEVVECEPSNGILTFYDIEGRKINEAKLFKEEHWDPENRYIDGKFSRNSEYFAVNFYERLESETLPSSWLVFFDKSGNCLWKFKYEEAQCSAIDISRNGIYILGSSVTFKENNNSVEATYLFNQEGEVIRKYLGLFATKDYNRFSEEENLLLINDVNVRKSMCLVSANTGDILFKFSTLGKPGYVKSVDIASKNELIGLAYLNEVIIIQFNGIKFWSGIVGDKLTDFRFYKNGDAFITRSGNKLLRFRRVK